MQEINSMFFETRFSQPSPSVPDHSKFAPYSQQPLQLLKERHISAVI